MIRLDLNGRLVSLDREVALQLREAAARGAAKSSTVRDLSLVLDLRVPKPDSPADEPSENVSATNAVESDGGL